jgi:outer membrane protein TolC
MRIVSFRRHSIALGFAALLLASAGRSDVAPSDAQLAGSLDRATVLRAALARNPGARVYEERARAMRTAARAEGGLPPPELMGQVWQVPFSRPAALDSQMIMIGVTQSFPAPGSLSARERAAEAEAGKEEAMAADRARMIVRDAGHAFASYEEASSKHRIDRAQLELARHLLDVARARHAGGGSLGDVARADVEVSRVEADLVTDATRVVSARSQLNALLDRAPEAPLGQPAEAEPMVPAPDVPTLLAKARATRPELKQVEAEREARRFAQKAAENEATWPSFSVGALYFPPTVAMPEHGYGASLSMSLPWLWGAARNRAQAERELVRAASTNVDATRIPLDAEVVVAEANARSAASRFQVLRDRALPASQRSLEVAQAGYESGRTDFMTVLDARRSVVDVENEIVMARATLAHALTDLEAAVGADIPLRPLADQATAGGSHAR